MFDYFICLNNNKFSGTYSLFGCLDLKSVIPHAAPDDRFLKASRFAPSCVVMSSMELDVEKWVNILLVESWPYFNIIWRKRDCWSCRSDVKT